MFRYKNVIKKTQKYNKIPKDFTYLSVWIVCYYDQVGIRRTLILEGGRVFKPAN